MDSSPDVTVGSWCSSDDVSLSDSVVCSSVGVCAAGNELNGGEGSSSEEWDSLSEAFAVLGEGFDVEMSALDVDECGLKAGSDESSDDSSASWSVD